MRNFCLLLHGVSLLSLSGHIFPNEFPAIVLSVVTAGVKTFLLVLTSLNFLKAF